MSVFARFFAMPRAGSMTFGGFQLADAIRELACKRALPVAISRFAGWATPRHR